MAPGWLYAGLSREEAEGKIKAAGVDDGRFLVRDRGASNPGEYVICVVYKGKPTHHLVKKDESGALLVNKKSFGGASDIETLVNALKKKQPGWPVPLDKPVSAGGGGGGGGGAKKASPKKAGGKPKKPGYIHDKLSREQAEALIEEAGTDNGRFLLRTREGKPGEYVLCVVYKGKPTHHLITKNPEGLYIVNKKPFGNTKKIVKLVETLSTKCPGWPVPLDKPVNRKGAASAKTAPAAAEDDDGAKEALAAAEKAKEEAQKAKEEAAAAKAEAENKAKEEAEKKEPEEAAKEPEPEAPKAEEPEAPKTEEPAEPAKEPEPAAPEVTSEADALVAKAKEAADLAVKEVSERKKELEDLKARAQLPGQMRLDGEHPGQGTSTDVTATKSTPLLARSVIKMGQRLSELEMQMHQLVQLMGALRDHARRIGLEQ